MSSGGNVPTPSLSGEERQLLETVNGLLGQQGIRLTEQDLQNRQVYDLFQNLSGLYGDPVSVPEQREDRFNAGKADALLNSGKPIDGKMYLTRSSREQFLNELRAKPELARKYGLIDSVVTSQARTDRPLNPQAVAQLKAQLDTVRADQERIGALERQNYERALRGEGPISEATNVRKAEDFARLRENLSRTGNKIVGDTPETAVAPSTAGNATLERFNRTNRIAEDAERRGYLGFGAGTVDRYSPAAQPMGYLGGAQPFGPAATMPGYANLAQGYLGLTQPYSNLRQAQYQAQVANASQPGFLPQLANIGANLGSSYLFYNWMNPRAGVPRTKSNPGSPVGTEYGYSDIWNS